MLFTRIVSTVHSTPTDQKSSARLRVERVREEQHGGGGGED